MTSHRALPAVAALAAALILPACGSGEREVQPVGTEDLAEAVAERVGAEIGYGPEVVCPDELPAEVGASVTCDLTTPTGSLAATVTVTEVDTETGTVLFDVLVDAPTP